MKTVVCAGFLAAGMLGAVAARVEPQTAPTSQRLSRDWKRLPGAGLEVVGNAPEKDLRQAADAIDAFRDVLETLLPGLRFTSVEPTRLVVFRDYTSFEPFVPRDGRGRRQQGVGGYFHADPTANVLVVPARSNVRGTLRLAFHEYTHFLIRHILPHAPLWLHEGLADFYSTVEVNENGKAIIGTAPRAHVYTLARKSLPPLSKLLSGQSASRLFNGADTEMFYAHSWIFVHYLILGEDGRRQAQIGRYLQLLQSSQSYGEAAERAFGSDLKDLDRALAAYARRVQPPAVAISTTSVAGSLREPAQAVSEADAAAIQAELLVGAGAPKEAERFLAKALAVDSRHRGARIALGRARILQQRYEEAVAVLEPQAGSDGAPFAAHFYLGAALDGAGRREESLAEYRRAVAINERSASAWFGVSAAAMSLGRDADSDAAMRQVESLDPSATWQRARALGAFESGRNDVAARAAHRYLDLAGIADQSGQYVAFIGAIAGWRLGDRADADALLAQAAAAAPPKSWVAAVATYLQGRLTADAFLGRARDNGQRTEAHTYIGIRTLLAGRPEDARPHFVWVKDRGDRNYTEYTVALAELNRVGAAR